MSATARRRRLGALGKLRGISPRRTLAALTPSPKLRRRMLIVAAVIALLGATYLVWLRDSGLVAVDDVVVTGVSGRDAEAVRAALQRSGEQMTTLHVRRGELEDSVAGFATVRSLAVKSDFPHRLEIRVLEHRPIATLVAGGKRIALAGDGTLLEGVSVKGTLPEIRSASAVDGDELPAGFARDAARVAGGAPAALTARLERVTTSKTKGLVVEVAGDGPQLIFGKPTDIARKWRAALRVFADRDAAGASYIDVRVAGRPVAGGLAVETVAPVASAEAQDDAAGQAAGGDGAPPAPTESEPPTTAGAQAQQTATPATAPDTPEAPSGDAQTPAPESQP